MLKLKEITAHNEELLSSLSFDAEEKGIYGILVPNSEAREALCEIIAGISSDYSGEITIRKNVYRSENTEKEQIAQRRKVGYLPSSMSLYGDMTVYETLEFVGNAKKIASAKKYKQIKEALELVGLDGYKDILVSKLTLWQMKRIFVAMALLGNPDILVLNEPFGGLDSRAIDDFNALLKMIGGVKCVILVTSNAEGVEDICKRVAVIVDGKLLINDTVDSINEKINGTRTMLVRVISKDGNKDDAITDMAGSFEGVASCSQRSKSEQGEVVLNLECQPDCNEDVILSAFKENGYIVLSHETIKLTLRDICSAMTEEEEK